jgi:hypothetical protein
MRSSDLGALLHYAMRYAMGRYTYAVDDVTRLIREEWRNITDNDRAQISAELDAEVKRHDLDGKTLGPEFVAKLWRDMRDFAVADTGERAK